MLHSTGSKLWVDRDGQDAQEPKLYRRQHRASTSPTKAPPQMALLERSSKRARMR